MAALGFAKNPSGFRIKQMKDLATYVRWTLSSELMRAVTVFLGPRQQISGSGAASAYRPEKAGFWAERIVGEPQVERG